MSIRKNLSPGKIRGLQECATERGVFSILAMDHRNNLRRSLNPASPDSVADEDLVAFKQDVAIHVAPGSSAILLDLEFGVLQSIESGAVAGSTGLIAALERTGYVGRRTERRSTLLSGWGPARARDAGASAVKLLVYYHPDSPTAGEIEALVESVGQECLAADVALFVEPLTYSVDPAQKRLRGEERLRAIVKTARCLSVIPGVDVMKVEFPFDIAVSTDQAAWSVACDELDAASSVPWVLLSAGVDFETYMRQVIVAAQAGASGVAAGRAVWKEAAGLSGAARQVFLATTARDRMARLTALCNALALPWRMRVAGQRQE